MIQTENTAIVLRFANYRDYDRMVTLLSPSRGRIDAMIRGCRKPSSHNLNAAELFALGDYMLHEADGRAAVTSVKLIETFYPLRNDYTRLTCGVYLLNLAEAAAEPEQEQRELFMLLVHTLSRLTFSGQAWKPLLAGFLPRMQKRKEPGSPGSGTGPVDAQRPEVRLRLLGRFSLRLRPLPAAPQLCGTAHGPPDQKRRHAAE